jgi:hypothetical protein
MTLEYSDIGFPQLARRPLPPQYSQRSFGQRRGTSAGVSIWRYLSAWLNTCRPWGAGGGSRSAAGRAVAMPRRRSKGLRRAPPSHATAASATAKISERDPQDLHSPGCGRADPERNGWQAWPAELPVVPAPTARLADAAARDRVEPWNNTTQARTQDTRE